MKAKQKLIAKFFIASACAVIIFGLLPSFASAATKPGLPLDDKNYNTELIAPKGETAKAKIESALGIGDNAQGGILYVVKNIITALAVLLIIISAVRILTAGGDEEVIKKQTKQIMYSIGGLVLISLSGDLWKVFDFSQGGMLKDPTQMIKSVTWFNRETQIVITFFKYLIGGVAIFQMIASGLHLITMEDPAKVEEDKKKLMYGAGGLILIVMSNTIIDKIFYKLDITKYTGTTGVMPAIDAMAGLKEIVGITNFVVAILGPLCVLALIAGAIMYVVSGGAEEKTKQATRVITAAAIGIVIVYGAFAIVSTVIARKFTG
ncbi:MAG: hypothetical protein UT33_C0015G0002 [Candidatus Peregrinibacteria bacterium GW2011_GWC2_39_14]|nr:MAG: hypothetical protein US92_C0007G0002 [Candidatus Peregrinibacteria bacterium GW2011_GWA2_38_36]KKR04945.1 MAG: hypothetical protein UT33_C0015G0002 [Candidatus Peregrinibacteria bacterium GW2011_GWC2_39_14]